jgi:hypothetical protein
VCFDWIRYLDLAHGALLFSDARLSHEGSVEALAK